MTDKSDGAGFLTCPCVSCILAEVLRLEQRKLYKEADQFISKGLRHYLAGYKELDHERSELRARIKNFDVSNRIGIGNSILCSDELQTVSKSPRCHYTFHGQNTKTREFSCPLAIFDAIPDPNQKVMYPKNIVYLDGQDNQLEEIWAAKYYAKNRSQGLEIPNNLKKIMSSEQFISFTKDKMSSESMKNPATDITNLVKSARTAVLASTPKTLKNNLVKPIAENVNKIPKIIVSNENSEDVPQSKSELSKSFQTKSQVPLVRSSPEKVILACTPKTSKDTTNAAETTYENLENTSLACAVETLKNTKSVSIEDSTKHELVERTFVMSIGEVPEIIISKNLNDNPQLENELSAGLQTRRRILPPENTLSTCVPKISEDLNSTGALNNDNTFVKSVSDSSFEFTAPNKNSIPIPQVKDKLCKGVQMRSRIPCSKSVSSSKKFQPEPSSTCEVPEEARSSLTVRKPIPLATYSSETFVVAKPSASETYVVKPEEVFVTPIEEETITLVEDEENHDLEEATCSTKAFRVVLPSSTPNKRRSQFFKIPDGNVDRTYVVRDGLTVPNLSMIVEISKEHYSTSSGTTTATKLSIPSQKTPLEPSNESANNKKSECIAYVSDPFDLDLIEQLLQEAQFPRQEHMDGYNKMNCDMAQMKLSSTVRLGENKFNICGEIGKGSYARILKLQDTKDANKLIAIKQQKPACPWEFYISKEIQRRLKTDEKKRYFIEYSNIFLYRNGSVMMSDWAQYGSILNFVNSLTTSPYHNSRCPMGVAVWLSIQFVEAIRYLHSCNIIHGDIKPDNFVLFNLITTQHNCIKLIDYGRSIDMNLLPKNVVFSKVVSTENFTCNEMKDNRPWTYQTDLFGLAGTMYLLLVGEYMKTTKQTSGNWALKKNLPRYMNPELWNPIFENLLNVPSCTELPDLKAIELNLREYFDSLDKQSINQQFVNVSQLFKK